MTLVFCYKIVVGRPMFYPIDPVSTTFLTIGRNRQKSCLSAKDFIEVLKLKRQSVEILVLNEDSSQLPARELISILGI